MAQFGSASRLGREGHRFESCYPDSINRKDNKMPHYPAPVNLKVHHHSLHLVITLITAGFWVPIWALITWDINRQNRRELDRYSREMTNYTLAVRAMTP